MNFPLVHRLSHLLLLLPLSLLSLDVPALLLDSQCILGSSRVITVSKISTGVNMQAFQGFHIKCRFPNEYCYKDSDGMERRIVRQEVPAGSMSWSASLYSYDPIAFTAPHVLTAPWADPDLHDTSFKPNWNSLDGKINRSSHEGEYQISKSNEPLNIVGRTGLKGRGVLGRWGPNHAADPIVSRWKRTTEGEVVEDERTGRKVLQFVAIQRRDTGEWAIPGGMVDPGENVSETVRREFMEEALDSTSITVEEERKKMEDMVKSFFEKGEKIYAGYVDDPRNTDNSWMETTAFSFHDDTGTEIGKFKLKAGDDAKALKWIDVSDDILLYASHKDLLKKVSEMKDAHW